MSDAARDRWDVAKKFLSDLESAQATDEVLAIEDVICAEFARVAELEADVVKLTAALGWLAENRDECPEEFRGFDVACPLPEGVEAGSSEQCCRCLISAALKAGETTTPQSSDLPDMGVWNWTCEECGREHTISGPGAENAAECPCGAKAWLAYPAVLSEEVEDDE